MTSLVQADFEAYKELKSWWEILTSLKHILRRYKMYTLSLSWFHKSPQFQHHFAAKCCFPVGLTCKHHWMDVTQEQDNTDINDRWKATTQTELDDGAPHAIRDAQPLDAQRQSLRPGRRPRHWYWAQNYTGLCFQDPQSHNTMKPTGSFFD